MSIKLCWREILNVAHIGIYIKTIYIRFTQGLGFLMVTTVGDLNGFACQRRGRRHTRPSMMTLLCDTT